MKVYVCTVCKRAMGGGATVLKLTGEKEKAISIVLCPVCWRKLIHPIILRNQDEILERIQEMCGIKFNPSSRIRWK